MYPLDMNAIAESLDREIRQGRYPANTRLPSERELSRRYNVPLSVARKALGALADRGLIYRVERGGSFVNLQPRLNKLLSTDFPLQCINFIEPLRGRLDPFAFSLSEYLNGYTFMLQQHPLRVRFVTIAPGERDFAGLLNPDMPPAEQGCVIGDYLCADLFRRLAECETPFVFRRFAGYPFESFPAHHGVFLNRNAASYEAVRHLMEQGHARIGFIGETGIRSSFTERYGLDQCPYIEGYQAAFALSGLAPSPAWMATVDGVSTAGIRAATERLLSLPDRPTGMVCQNDLTALTVMETARRLGLRIPADLSVIGFDNDPAGAQSDPPLTTFGGHEALASAALERLFAIGDNRALTPEVRPLPCPMILRDSTGPGPGSK